MVSESGLNINSGNLLTNKESSDMFPSEAFI